MSIETMDTTEEEIYNTLSTLDPHRATDIYSISPAILLFFNLMFLLGILFRFTSAKRAYVFA